MCLKDLDFVLNQKSYVEIKDAIQIALRVNSR